MNLYQGATLSQEAVVGLLTNSMSAIYNPLPSPYTGCIVELGKWTWQRYVPILIFEISAWANSFTVN